MNPNPNHKAQIVSSLSEVIMKSLLDQPRKFQFSPKQLGRWLSPADVQRRIVIVDTEVDEAPKGGLRIDLTVAFNAIPVRSGLLVRETFYIGCSSARASVQAVGGTIVAHSGDHTINVTYNNELSYTRSSETVIEPKITRKDEQGELSASAGSVSFGASEQRKFVTAFSGIERLLAAVIAGPQVTWIVDQPRGDKAVRDYLLGMLHVWATINWPAGSASWRIEVQPDDIRFFDGDKRPIKKISSLVMKYILARRKALRLDDLSGPVVEFEEVRQ
jgi:hypothetical protein